MNFNNWSILFTIAAGQGLFLFLVLLFRKDNRLPNRLLACFLLLSAFTLFQWILWWTGGIRKVPGMMGLEFSVPLLYGPLMFLFYQFTFERKTFRPTDLAHFIPAIIGVFLMLPFYLRFYESLSSALQWIPPITRKPWFPLLVFAQMIGYGIWVGVRFKKYVRKDKELRNWHRYLMGAYFGIVLAYVFYRLLSPLGLTAPEWMYLIAFSLTFFIYLVAWLGYIEPRVFQGVPLRKAIHPAKYQKSSLTNTQSKKVFEQINGLMEVEKIYRHSNCSLDLLARHLGEQRHHISQSVNEQSGVSFPNYISSFRIKEAQELLRTKSKREMNINEVAFAVGFNTKKAFNLAFKNKTGMTPSAFRRQLASRVNDLS